MSEQPILPEDDDLDLAALGEPDVDREPLSPTEEDVADGNHLGEVIDVNDDNDSGARETYL